MTKTISLTRGYVAIVDDEDHEWLSQWSWCANVKDHGVYAYRCPGDRNKKTSIYMHRLILGIQGQRGIEGDHKNGDTLDNRRRNLRKATRAQNARNQAVRTDNTSGVRGVGWIKKDKVYRARIHISGKEIIIGYSKNFDEAVEMRRRAELEYYEDYVRPD